MNPLERKQKSIEILKANQVTYIEGLSVIEDVHEIEVRSAEEIAKRAIAEEIYIYKKRRIN